MIKISIDHRHNILHYAKRIEDHYQNVRKRKGSDELFKSFGRFILSKKSFLAVCVQNNEKLFFQVKLVRIVAQSFCSLAR